VGAGFIGMEAAAALRARGLEVHVIAPDAVPMERVLGRELGEFVTSLHRENGVVFHLQSTAKAFDGTSLTLADGTVIDAQFVIVGTGVTPRTALAAAAGIAVDDGILVDAQLQTSVPGHYAAGDVARYRHDGELVRVEHWVHAQRQGQVAAANLLGANEAFSDLPFFWTHHYGLDLRYSGHGQGWDQVREDREPASLLDRCHATRTCPKVFETFGATEFTGRLMSIALTGTDGKADLPLPPNVRRYYFPGTTHGGGQTRPLRYVDARADITGGDEAVVRSTCRRSWCRRFGTPM